MGRRLTFLLFAFAAFAVLAPASALAAKKKTTPKVSKVSPMRLRVGATLTIRGKNFSSHRTRNTVIFRSPGGRTAFVKPRRASRTKLVVKVPASVARLLSVKSGSPQPTRFKLRVVTGRFGSYTIRRLSPVIVPVGGSGTTPRGGGGSGGSGSPVTGGSAPCGSGDDWDNDLLTNQFERDIHTDPCLADTDGDTMSDGWEYYSARDLNLKAVPYPGSRPWTNPLDPSDANVDYDGDGLKALEEYKAWRVSGSSFIPAKASGSDDESPLGYSDGTQSSRASEVPPAPVWHSASYGQTPPSQSFPALYDFNGDGLYTDDERDADRDGLNNYIESAGGPGRASWWASLWSSMSVPKWPDTYYGDFSGQRPFGTLALANPDVDADGLLDGEDDEDFDGWNNVVEMYETIEDADGNSQILSVDRGGTDYFVNAFNPCAPDTASRTCSRYQPF